MRRQNPDDLAEDCAEYVVVLLPALRYVAYRCGYALATHGSVARDIDIIACPWRDSAIDAESLIERLVRATEAIVGIARVADHSPEVKPCGRLAWSVFLTTDALPYLDISVMPKGNT